MPPDAHRLASSSAEQKQALAKQAYPTPQSNALTSRLHTDDGDFTRRGLQRQQELVRRLHDLAYPCQ